MAPPQRDDLPTFAGHAVIAFNSRTHAEGACRALADIGYTSQHVRHWTENDMLRPLKAAIRNDRDRAGLPCSDKSGHDLLVVRHPNRKARADRSGVEATAPGNHWLIVRVKNEGRAQQVLDHVLSFEPQRARYYRQAGFVELMDSGFPSSLPWPSSLALTDSLEDHVVR